MPDGDLKQIGQLSDEYYYELTVADDVEDYCVVVEKADSSGILRNSAMRKHRGQHEFLIIFDGLSRRR
jgi:hypothetical protein